MNKNKTYCSIFVLYTYTYLCFFHLHVSIAHLIVRTTRGFC